MIVSLPLSLHLHLSTPLSLYFGIITCVTGVLGVASGVAISTWLRTRTPRADPLVCAAGLLLAAPFLYLAIVFAQASTVATYVRLAPPLPSAHTLFGGCQ